MVIYVVTALTLLNYTAFKGCKMLTSLFALELGASQLLVGVIYSMYAVFPIFLAVYAGKVGDRIGFRIPMLLGTAGVAGGVLLPAFVPNLVGLALSTALIGMCFIFFSVCVQSAVGLLPGDRTRNYAVLSLGNAASSFLGPVIAGLSIDLQGHASTYLFVGLLPVGSFVLLALVPGIVAKAKKAAKKAAQVRTTEMLESHPNLRRILIAGATTEAALELYAFYMPIYGHSIGLSASQIGMVMGAYAVAMVAIRLGSPWLVKQLGEEQVLRLAMLVAAAVYCLFPFAGHIAHLGILSFVLGLSLGCCVPLAQMIIHSRAPAGRGGEAMGVRHMLNKSIGLSAPLLYAWLGALVGTLPIFWASATVLFAGNLLVPAPSAPISPAGEIDAGMERAQNQTASPSG